MRVTTHFMPQILYKKCKFNVWNIGKPTANRKHQEKNDSYNTKKIHSVLFPSVLYDVNA